MGEQIWSMLGAIILAGIFIFLILALWPLINQLKKTARQVEMTAASLDRILNNELKVILQQGEKALEEIESTPPWIREKLSALSNLATCAPFRGIGSKLAFSLVCWGVRTIVKKVRKHPKLEA